MDSNNATRALLCKCFDHLNQEIARLSLNASAASGKQALSREIAEHLDALAAQQSVPPADSKYMPVKPGADVSGMESDGASYTFKPDSK